ERVPFRRKPRPRRMRLEAWRRATKEQEPTTMAQRSALYTFDADRVAWLETRMWEAYYAKQDLRLFLLLIRLVAQQFGLARLRAEAAIRCDTGRDAEGVRGASYWPTVADLLQRSYRALSTAVQRDTV